MIRSVLLKVIVFIALVQTAIGQEKSSNIYVDSLGEVYVQANQPVYFFIAPESNPNKKFLIPGNDSLSNPMFFDGNGTHYLRTFDSETNKPISFKIFADGIAPAIDLNFQNGLLMKSGNRYYVNIGSTADLVAKDNLSGVRRRLVSIDGGEYKNLTKILFDKENDYLLKSFAVDNVGNISDTIQFHVITAVNSIVKIKNIYFDTNSSILRSDSKEELNSLVTILNEYPEIVIEIRAHTDCRGDANYNLLLSERRAESVVNYLIHKGIKQTQLTFKGFGSSNPINECTPGVICSDEKHQENRRVEFKILPIK